MSKAQILLVIGQRSGLNYKIVLLNYLFCCQGHQEFKYFFLVPSLSVKETIILYTTFIYKFTFLLSLISLSIQETYCHYYKIVPVKIEEYSNKINYVSLNLM